MNYDNEIDKLEERFRQDGFQESMTAEDLKKLESIFMSMAKDLYQLKKLERTPDITNTQRELIGDLHNQVNEKLQFCKAMSGLE